jgi:hypothetical protein
MNARDLDTELDVLDVVCERLAAYERAYNELLAACQRRDAPPGLAAAFDRAFQAGDVGRGAELSEAVLRIADDVNRERGGE